MHAPRGGPTNARPVSLPNAANTLAVFTLDRGDEATVPAASLILGSDVQDVSGSAGSAPRRKFHAAPLDPSWRVPPTVARAARNDPERFRTKHAPIYHRRDPRVETGSRKENASKQRNRTSLLIPSSSGASGSARTPSIPIGRISTRRKPGSSSPPCTRTGHATGSMPAVIPRRSERRPQAHVRVRQRQERWPASAPVAGSDRTAPAHR